jgi:lipoprotein NlpI
LLDEGDRTGALAAFQQALHGAQQLAQSHPDDLVLRHDVGYGEQRVGDVLFLQEDYARSLPLYLDCLTIFEAVVKAVPDRVDWRGDLSNSQYRIGLILLRQGKASEAVGHFTAAIDANARTSPGGLRLMLSKRGFAELDAGDAATAADDARKALQIDAKSAYAVLLLRIASLSAGADDADEFAKVTQPLDKSAWPWSAVAMFQGAISPQDALEAASAATDPKTRVDQVCEADYYAGAYELTKGDKDSSRPLLQAAIDACPRSYDEYTAASYALNRMR